MTIDRFGQSGDRGVQYDNHPPVVVNEPDWAGLFEATSSWAENDGDLRHLAELIGEALQRAVKVLEKDLVLDESDLDPLWLASYRSHLRTSLSLVESRHMDAMNREWLGIAAELSEAITSGLSERDQRELIVKYLGQRFHYDVVSLITVDRDQGIVYSDIRHTTDGMEYQYRQQEMEKGLVGRAIRDGHPIIVQDNVDDPDYIRVVGGTRSTLCIPMFIGKEVEYVLNLEHNKRDEFDDVAMARFRILVRTIAKGLQNARLYQREVDRADQMAVLVELAHISLQSLELDQVAKRACEALVRLGVVDEAGLLLMEPGGRSMRLVHRTGLFGPGPSDYSQDIETGVLGWVVRHDRPYIVEDAEKDELFLEVDFLQARSELALPLRSATGIEGVLDFEHSRPGMFRQRDLPLFEAIADLVASALENARLYAEIHEMESQRSLWFDSLSHELKTPLNAILAFGQLLEEEIEDDPYLRGMTGKIGRAGRQLLELVEEVMSFSRLRSRMIELDLERFQWQSLQEGLEASLSAQAAAANVTIRFDLQGEAHGDPFWLRQVISNLVSNAIKYAGEGIEVQIRSQPNRVEVGDNGSGMEPEVAARLFEPFYQASSAHRDRGTGLGLSICEEVTRLHGGSIGVETKPGLGSIFTIELPPVQG